MKTADGRTPPTNEKRSNPIPSAVFVGRSIDEEGRQPGRGRRTERQCNSESSKDPSIKVIDRNRGGTEQQRQKESDSQQERETETEAR